MKLKKFLFTLLALGSLGAYVEAAAPPQPQGIITAREWLGIGGTALSALTNNSRFPDAPDVVAYSPQFEWPINPTDPALPPPSDVKNDYGIQIVGYLYPPATGDYIFYLAGDDESALFLSTDDNPANKVLIAREPSWNPVRDWTSEARRPLVDEGTPNERRINVSRPIRLESGKAYYIEALVKEGGGGDNLAVAWQKPGDPVPDASTLPIPGQFLSTIDRLSLAAPYVSGFASSAGGFSFVIPDGTGAGAGQVNASTVNVTLNGNPITPAVSRSGNTTVVSYQQTPPFAAGSQNTVVLTFSDTLNPPNTVTSSKTFTVANYGTVPAGFKVPDAAVNKSERGFNLRIHQMENTRPGGNNLPAPLLQLQGALIDPNTGQPYENLIDVWHFEEFENWDGVIYKETGVINYNQDARSNPSAGIGNFQPDKPIPGIPGITSSTDNIAMEGTTYLELKAGAYRMGVNSDDGFIVSVAPHPNDKLPIRLGLFDGGRGAADTIFDLVVEEDGIYPFILHWWEGDGGANLEWFHVDAATGEKILINDDSKPNSIKAYRTATVAAPHVKNITPIPGSTGHPIDATIEVVLTDGSRQVAGNSVQMKINGQDVTPTVSKSGADTTVRHQLANDPARSSAINVELSYADNATPAFTRTVNFAFTTIRLPNTRAAFQQGEDGLVVIEAENFHAHTAQGGHDWLFAVDRNNYSGDGFMRGMPDTGVNRSGYPDLLTMSPRLDYKVNFVKTGTHYVWIRGFATGGEDDSVHAGIGGDNPATARRIDGGGGFSPNNSWVWVGSIQESTEGSTRTRINVPSAGEHQVNVWMREDGFRFDKIIITSDASFTPSGLGPAESRPAGAAPPPTVAISSPAEAAQFPAGGNITVTATASAEGRTISKVEFFANGTKIGEATSSPFTVTWNNVAQGRYVLTAQATDNTNDTGTSAAVNILVGNPPEQVLLVVVAGGGLNASDAAFKARLESFGFEVQVVGDTDSQTSHADGKALVVTSSTVGSGNVTTKFRNVPIPVINWEQALQDDYAMTLNTDADRGSLGTQTELNIINADHPLAAGLSAGLHTVASSPVTFSWGVPHASAIRIATVAGNPDQTLIHAFEKGATMIGDFVAPARRVHLFLEDNAYAALTEAGLKLVDAAIAWALDRSLEPSDESKFNTPVLQGNNVTISWTGPGTLEQADAVTGPWSPAPNQNNPQTIPTTEAMKFYRIRQ